MSIPNIRSPWLTVLIGSIGWLVLIFYNSAWWTWLLVTLGITESTPIGAAVHFFLYDTTKIFLLLIGLIFVLGLARASLNLERVRAYLAGRGHTFGLIMAVVLGIATPFCSCSSIPLFIGFVASGIPLSITLTFLIASPLASETAALLIGIEFGWTVAGAYLAAGAILSFALGWVLRFIPLDKWVEPSILNARFTHTADQESLGFAERVTIARTEVADILRKTWIWIIVGVGIGAIIHGWVPVNYFADSGLLTGPLAVPVATLLGVPLYANGGAIVPIGQALWATGIPIGTVMSLMMGAIALSIPEAVMLRQVMKPQLLVIFFSTVTFGIMIIGWIFNILFT